MTRLTEAEFQAIGRDLELCDLGAALTKGKRRARFLAQREAIFAAIKAHNDAEGMPKMTDDELLAALAEDSTT